MVRLNTKNYLIDYFRINRINYQFLIGLRFPARI